MRHFIRSLLKLALVGIGLSLTDCRATHSSDLSRAGVKVGESQLAGYPILRWHKVNSGGVTIKFPGALFQDSSARYWVGNGVGLYVYDDKQNVWTSVPREALRMQVTDIKQIAETRDRSLWIRSMHVLTDNLRTYDGENWHSIPRFSKSRVSAMFTGKAGRLWFAAGDELVSYDGKSWSPQWKLSEMIQRTEESYTNISAGLEDRGGLVWIAIQASVISLDPATKRVKNRLEDETLAHVQSMCEDSEGNIWFGTSDGSLSLFKRGENSLRNYDLSEYVQLREQPKDRFSLPKIGVNAILQDKTGQMLVATTRGLVTIDPTGNNWQVFTKDNSPLPEGSITALMEDAEGRVWIGTGDGILVLDK